MWTAVLWTGRQSSSVSADMDPPAFLDVWPGMAVTVTCVNGLLAPSGGTGGLLNTDGTLTLDMMVQAWKSSRNDWGATTSWELDLQEI